MSGLIFLKCNSLSSMKDFYMNTVGMEVWLEQPDICILRHGNFLIGFHEAGQVDDGCLLTFYYDTREEVDAMYGPLKDRASFPPRVNEKYRIYHFFAKDPEGRDIEFQHFLHPVGSDWS